MTDEIEVINEDRHVSNIIAAITLAVAATAITIVVVLSLLELKPWRVPNTSAAIYFHGAYTDAPDDWWCSRYAYSDSAAVCQRAWDDRWQIGNRTYRTSDLMGRRI
jgi:hypothetical protein